MTHSYKMSEEAPDANASNPQVTYYASPKDIAGNKLIAEKLMKLYKKLPKLEKEIPRAESDARESGYEGLLNELNLHIKVGNEPFLPDKQKRAMEKLRNLYHEISKSKNSISRLQATAVNRGFEGYYTVDGLLRWGKNGYLHGAGYGAPPEGLRGDEEEAHAASLPNEQPGAASSSRGRGRGHQHDAATASGAASSSSSGAASGSHGRIPRGLVAETPKQRKPSRRVTGKQKQHMPVYEKPSRRASKKQSQKQSQQQQSPPPAAEGSSDISKRWRTLKTPSKQAAEQAAAGISNSQ